LWNGSDDLQLLGRFVAGRNANVSYEGRPLGAPALEVLRIEIKKLAAALGTDVYLAGRPQYVGQTGAVVAGRGVVPEWHRAVGSNGPRRFITNSYGALVPEKSRRVEGLARIGLSPVDLHMKAFPGGLALALAATSGYRPSGPPAKVPSPTALEQASAADEFLVVASGALDEVWTAPSTSETWLNTGPEALLTVLRTGGWDGLSPIRLVVHGLAFPDTQQAAAIPGIRFGQALANSAGTTVFVPVGKVDWDAVADGAVLGDSGNWVTYTPQLRPDLTEVERQAARLPSEALSVLERRAERALEAFGGPRGETSVGRAARLRVALALFQHGPVEADRLAAQLAAEYVAASPPPYTLVLDEALLLPADRKVLAALAAHPPLAEVQARLDALPKRERERRLRRAERMLHRPLVIGSEELAARNRLYDEVQVRLAERLAEGEVHARELLRELGLQPTGRLLGGMDPSRRQREYPSTPELSSSTSTASTASVSILPAAEPSPGVVVLSSRDTDIHEFASVMPETGLITAVLWVGEDGSPIVP
ncbi:hypothetical protein ACFXKJ_41415, partial [Kitasatospora indigofera]|uniref:hypothetical protein n=1 Tax=Kitasatospora indigofera TaxID=67307 RepID=UPI0036B83424